jgi:hypothetical protein
MKQIVRDRDDIAFYIKLLPLKIHPAAFKKARAIVCERSLRLLEHAFDGRALPDPSCKTSEVEETIELAERLGITGTPTLVLPDGGVINGYRDSVPLQKAIETAGLAAEEKEREELQRQQAEEERLLREKLEEQERLEEQDSGQQQGMVNGVENDVGPVEEENPSGGNAPTMPGPGVPSGGF